MSSARVAVWMLWIGVAPLACVLTTDLDKLRGPMGGGGAATGGAGGGGQGPGATGGGHAGGDGGGGVGGNGEGATLRIAYASAAEVAALSYDGNCNEALWQGKNTDPINWPSGSITATCRLAWGPTVNKPKARTLYGCCEVHEPLLNPTHVGADCAPFQEDGIEYLFADSADNKTKTTVTMSAWGASCGDAVASYDINGTKTGFTPATLNCFTPLGGAESCSQTSETGANGFVLEWALPLDGYFSTDMSNVSCAFGVRSQLKTIGTVYGQVTSTGEDNMYKAANWGACTFEPPP